MTDLSKKFVTEDEIEEKKKKRQEEWEKVRKPDEPEEVPEEAYDHRTLYDRLEEQKLKKQEEFEETHKLKNQVRGLDEDESEFLDYVSTKQQEVERARHTEDEQVMNEYRNNMSSITAAQTAAVSKKPAPAKSAPQSASSRVSQSKLLAGAVKRKSASAGPSTSEEKKLKTSESNGEVTLSNSAASIAATPAATVVGRLPGIGAYTASDDDDESSDSRSEDSDVDTDLFKTAIRVHMSCAGGASE